MTRYDSSELLYDYQRTGRFPAIHDALFALVCSEVGPTDGAVLDLGSSTGLLTRRLSRAGFAVIGVEADQAAITAGRTAGTYGPGAHVRPMKITPETLPALSALLRDMECRIVVARRVLPELDDAGVAPGALGDVLADAGVRHLFLEGRAPRQDAKHRLRSAIIECAELERRWRTTTIDGKHRVYLTVKE